MMWMMLNLIGKCTEIFRSLLPSLDTFSVFMVTKIPNNLLDLLMTPGIKRNKSTADKIQPVAYHGPKSKYSDLSGPNKTHNSQCCCFQIGISKNILNNPHGPQYVRM